MPSRLSSLLVRDGLVGVKRMEKAFQRQVIYGGSLDTILLEMNLVPEERLTQYLALASGLPPAARDEGGDIAPEALALIAREIAEQFRAVPLSVSGEALRVLVCSPLELTELEDLADLLDRPLQPLITPEYRWHLVYARAYGVDPPARYTTLARQLEVEAAPAPVGRSRSVIVEDPHATVPMASPLVPLPPVLPVGPVTPPATPVLAPIDASDETMKIAMPHEDSGRSRTSTMIGITPARAQTAEPAPLPEPPSRAQSSAPVKVTFAPSTSGVPRRIEPESNSAKTESGRITLPRFTVKAGSAPIATSGRDSPLAIVRARELLATAEDRDTVFLTLLRAARSRVRYAGLLTVQGGAAIGRVALAEPGLDTKAIEAVLIPLDSMSPFRTVVNNQQPHIGSLGSGDAAIDKMIIRLGGTMPPSALVMPIVLRERVVALVVAHRVFSDLKLIDVTELLPLASGAADALGRLIVKHKSAGYRAPTGTPNVEIEGEQVETKKIVKAEVEWRAPAQRPSVPVLEDAELTFTAEPPRPIALVIDDIERAAEGEAADAISDAVERATEALPLVAERFPGTLRVDRFTAGARPLRASQYGGLLDLVVKLGTISSELLIDKMTSPDRNVRFYATVCAAELRPRSAVYQLVERLFDQDFGVRAMALEALGGYPPSELTSALARARRAVHSSDPETVAAAVTAIVQLGDVEAVSDLIGAIERGDRAGEHVRKALVALTAQDFGTSERKWRKWYDGARRRHRIEWLIDGLGHKEDAIRESAINDLRRLTGEYFGYHHDLPRKERELAAERWQSWWREVGQRRFVFPEDERHRPTAVLPAQRGD